MKAYRVYFFSRDTRVSRPPEIIECQNDEQAKLRAKQLVKGYDVEVWEVARLVARV